MSSVSGTSSSAALPPLSTPDPASAPQTAASKQTSNSGTSGAYYTQLFNGLSLGPGVAPGDSDATALKAFADVEAAQGETRNARDTALIARVVTSSGTLLNANSQIEKLTTANGDLQQQESAAKSALAGHQQALVDATSAHDAAVAANDPATIASTQAAVDTATANVTADQSKIGGLQKQISTNTTNMASLQTSLPSLVNQLVAAVAALQAPRQSDVVTTQLTAQQVATIFSSIVNFAKAVREQQASVAFHDKVRKDDKLKDFQKAAKQLTEEVSGLLGAPAEPVLVSSLTDDYSDESHQNNNSSSNADQDRTPRLKFSI